MRNEAENILLNEAFQLLLNSVNTFKSNPIIGLQYCSAGINLMLGHFYDYFSLLESDEIDYNIELLKRKQSPEITTEELKREFDNLKTFINARTVARLYNNRQY